MTHFTRQPLPLLAALVAVLVATLQGQQTTQSERPSDDAFRFRSGVELINVTTTVSDASGRFVPGLAKDDFLVFEDDRPVEVTHFSAERVPVSLGIALDTSGSMAGDKIREAEAALNRFTFELLDKDDEMFLYRFSNYPTLLQGWTTDRQLMSRALGRITPNGGTALYDTVVEAMPLAARGRFQKKALLIISDGNDTSSRAEIRDVKQQIRESEVLVYAIGIDGEASEPVRRSAPLPPPRVPFPVPLPVPTRRWWTRSLSAEKRGAAVRRRSGRQWTVVSRARRQSCQRHGASRHDRRQRRPDRDHPQRARSRSGDRRHRRRAEQAVLPRLSSDR